MQNWFVHLQGETLGPLTTNVVTSMLQQNRMQFADYIWKSGMTQWKRISDLDEFVRLLPPYPEVSVPAGDEPAEEAPKKREEKKEAPAPVVFPKARRYDRVSIDAKISSDEHGKFEVLDIGEGGLFVKAKTPLPIGTEIRFTLESGSFPKPLEMTGVVIRVTDSGSKIGFGIEFTRVNPAHKRLLSEYVKNRTR